MNETVLPPRRVPPSVPDDSSTGEAAASRMAYGGKTNYGARIGIIVMDTLFPRIPGDMGNGETFDFPVLFKVVRGSTPEWVHASGDDLVFKAFLEPAKEAVLDGADAVAVCCGLMSLHQKRLAGELGVPVATSALMQIPLINALLPPGKRCGVLTISSKLLTARHLEAAGAPTDTPVIGCEDGPEFLPMHRRADPYADIALCEEEILEIGHALVERNPDVGAIVLECTNMPPYARALSDLVGLPVYDVVTFVNWFHAGLAPRDFGHPGSAPRPWRER